MTNETETTSYSLGEGEKATSVIVYTPNLLAWGEVVTKEVIRVSTWLRTAALPKYICLYNIHLLSFLGGATPKPQSFAELHLPSSQVVAFHIKPPAQDPLDYDPNEPNRKMEPISILIGPFRFDGSVRMSMQTSLDRYLDVAKESFGSLYDVEITYPSMPNLGVIRVPFVLVRNEMVLFSPRQAKI